MCVLNKYFLFYFSRFASELSLNAEVAMCILFSFFFFFLFLPFFGDGVLVYIYKYI